MHADVRLWWETGYDFVKRQSQADPNVWVYFEGFNRTAPQAVAAASAAPQNPSTPWPDPGPHLAGRAPR
jgi:hypothetical protein